MWKPRVGMRVNHRILGWGEIIGLTSSEVRIRLDKYKRRVVQVKTNEVEPEDTEIVSSDNIPMKKATDSTFPYRKAIDALRFGLVPEDFIEQLTIGFEDIEEWVLRRLPKANGDSPQVSEICGPFGSGKSHTMSVIRHIARKEGYATARVEVDGQNISLSNPEKLLCSLWSSLGATDFESPTPLLDIYIKAIERHNFPPRIAPRGIDRIHDNYSTIKLVKERGYLDKHGDALDAIISSSDEFTAQEVMGMLRKEPNIYGREVSVRRMIGQRVDDRPYDFVESLVGNAHIADLAGFNGLVVTIDEFEVERVYSANFNRVIALLNVLSAYFQGNLMHKDYPVSIFFATVGQEGNRGDSFVDFLIESTDGDWYEIQEMSSLDRFELAKRMHELYAKAYQIEMLFNPDVTEEVERQTCDYGEGDSGIIRAFIKRYIATLDRVYGPSGDN